MTQDSHCEAHDNIQYAINIANSNQEWFQRIGRWIVGLLSAIIVLIVPSLITFFVYIASIDRRVSLLEQRMTTYMEVRR